MGCLLVSGWLSAQAPTIEYNKQWKEIDSLINKNLTKSALGKVKQLEAQTIQAGNQVQQLKTLVYQLKLEDRVSETDINQRVKVLETKLDGTKDSVYRSIYHLMIAKALYHHFNSNRFKLYNRTTSKDVNKKDIQTWAIPDLFQKIQENLLKAIQPSNKLIKTDLTNFEPLLIRGNASSLRPTLFDLIANDALAIFKTQEGRINQPLEPYIIRDPKALANYEIFSQSKFNTNDSNSHYWISLQIFQQLIQSHLDDKNPEALVDVDLERINWVYRHSNITQKETAQLEAIQYIATHLAAVPIAAKAWYVVAQKYADDASGYLPNYDSSKRWKYVDAMKIVETVESKFSKDHPAKSEMESLKNSILSVSINTQTERVNIPEKPFRILLKFRNTNKLYFRIIQSDQHSALRDAYSSNELIKLACKLPAYRAFEQELPTTTDYQTHTTEMKVEGLPVGSYTLLCSTDKNFTDSTYPVSLQNFQVSNISYIQQDLDFYVLDRTTGLPLNNALVTTYLQERNQNGTYNGKWNKSEEYKTDKNGLIHFLANKNREYLRFNISYGKDHYLSTEYHYFNLTSDYPITNQTKYEKEKKQIFFFTDRSIYRPGQILFFKGISTTEDYYNKQCKLVIKDSCTIILKDANYQIIDSIKLVSNEYGSFHGQFQLPEKGLNGNYQIMAKNNGIGNAYIRVEQYKRPSFFLNFETPKEATRLNDSITVLLNLRSYAGNSLNNAKVKYRVMRNSKPSFTDYRSYSFPYKPTIEIANGQLITNQTGQCSIKFKANPDLTVDSNYQPIYVYIITVDATDPNGESRTSNTQVSVGYTDRYLSMDYKKQIHTDSLLTIGISVKNLNEQPLKAKLLLRIQPLKQPGKMFRNRYWSQPDLRLMDKDSFWKYFPTDEYDHETDFTTWEKTTSIYDTSLETSDIKDLQFKVGKLKGGFYALVASSIDNYGNKITNTNYIQIFDQEHLNESSFLQQPSYLEEKTYQPGDSLFLINHIFPKKAFLIQETYYGNKKTAIESVLINNGLYLQNLLVQESDRGGFVKTAIYVYDNRVYYHQFQIQVPWKNKELSIQYKSFRNKTEPGSQEKWSIELMGAKGDQKAAELISSMYDASLDAIKPHRWGFPNLWQKSTYAKGWNSYQNFYANNGQQNIFREFVAPRSKPIIYDELLLGLNSIYYQEYPNEFEPLHEVVVASYNTKSAKSISIRGASTKAFDAGSPVQEESYDKVFTTVDMIDPTTGEHIVNGRVVKDGKNSEDELVIRKNFSETAFFFPELHADSSGKYQLSFTMPDAVTKWKWQSFAHSKDLSTGYQSATIQTQKTLMLQSNAPRFFREGDKLEFSSRIANLSDKELTGQVTLELIDPSTNTSVDGWFQNIFPTQYFTVAAGQNSPVKFPIQIPYTYNKPLIWRVVARAGNYSDGEEQTIPVLSNRQLVTETLPIHTMGDTTVNLRFEKLLQEQSASASNESLTVEFSSNPAWYVVRSLPYLQEGNDQCIETLINRFYANAMAAQILNKYPKIKAYYQDWKKDSASLVSNLQKNQALKQVLIEETPWVLQAKTETEQMQALAQLFNLARLAEDQENQLKQLIEWQLPEGGFAWFKGGWTSPYMTNLVLTRIGQLKRLGAITPDMAIRLKPMLLKAVAYLDLVFLTQYEKLVSRKYDFAKAGINNWHIQYLFMRSFYGDIQINHTKAQQFYLKLGRTSWNRLGIEEKAMLAQVYYRNKETALVFDKLVPAILENAVQSKEKGMYWKIPNNYYWQGSEMATVIRVATMFAELTETGMASKLQAPLSAIKTWLILHKQTNYWGNAMGTADVCYAFLMSGTNWLDDQQTVRIQLGKTILDSKQLSTEAGSGYFQQRIDGAKMSADMGNIQVTTSSKNGPNSKTHQPAWGNIYWQYFENMDQITNANTSLKIQKQLLVEQHSNKGKILVPVDANNPMHVGDRLIIRLTINTDRDLEYVHLKDSRAAGMEPINALSGYKWQGGLGYYENTTDAATHFFFDKISKGVYVFDYPVFLTHLGDFSAGIANIQCLYAPGFNAHSEGIRLQVQE
jgi:hypothetical protein